jgi:hypothetical protein
MPDLVIKPTAGAGNKLILQDQGGGALLTSATSGATLADGITLADMSNFTFPTGHLISTTIWKDTSGTSGGYMIDSGPVQAIRNSISFSEISGNTYVITVNLYQYLSNINAGSTTSRRWYTYLRYGSNDSQGADVSSAGTLLYSVSNGRHMVTASGSSTHNSYADVELIGSYVASSTGTQYFTFASNTDGPTLDLFSYFHANFPAYYKVEEYQGSCLTILT